MSATGFLADLFGSELPPGLRIALWEKDGRRSAYLDAPGEAQAFEGREDVYVGAALTGCDLGPRLRPKARDAAAIPGVWADLDIEGTPDGDGGVKTGVAPSREAALTLARSLLEPTVLVHSGYGLQAWWLFEEPWVFGGDAERERAQQIVRGFQAALRQAASFGLDSTHDLARLMRLPGTLNAKGDEPVAVELEEDDGPRYAIEDLARLARDAVSARAVAPVAVNVGAEFPTMKFEALRENSHEFARTWEHERSDHPDWSDSEYDLALASQAAHANWTDDELAALIRRHRQSRNGDDPKAQRPDYIARTVAKAREGVADQGAPVGFDPETGQPVSKLERVRRDFPQLTGPNEIMRVVKLGGKQASHIFELASGETIELGTTKQALKPRDVQAAILDATDPPVAIPVPTLEEWRKVVERICAAGERREVTLDERDETREWVEDFVRSGLGPSGDWFVLKDPDQLTRLENLRQPKPMSYVQGEVAYIRLSALRYHLVFIRREEPISTVKLSERLGRIGFRRKEVGEREGKEVVTKGFYVGRWRERP